MVTFSWLPLLGLGLTMAAPAPPPRLYRGATFITQDPAQPRAKAMLVEGERVRWVSVQEPTALPPGTVVVDLGGGVAVPGLQDAHLHLAWLGQAAEMVDLRGSASAAEAVARVRQRLQAPVHGWVEGMGWDQNTWACAAAAAPCDGAMPTRALLDAVAPAVPVLLDRVDGHAAWVNSEALRRARAAGATALEKGGADPPGGRILRDGDGEATGVLIDKAVDLVRAHVPKPTAEDMERFVLAGAEKAARSGLTSVHAMSVDAQELAALTALDRQGRLPVRVFAYLAGQEDGVMARLPAVPARSATRLELRGIKLFADGALGSRGALLLAAYSDEPGQVGLHATDPKLVEERARAASARGFQVAVHAIGDGANREVLEMLARLGPKATKQRHRVEHAQVVNPQDWPRFRALGAIASMQPTHCTSDMGWAEQRLGKDRLKGAYAWKSLLQAGAVLAFGSDAPVESEQPLGGLVAATTRTDAAGHPPGGWQPQERLSPEEALRAFTLGAAYAVGREDELGVLKPGALADFTVLDGDPLAGGDLRALHVKKTVVGGQER